MIQHNAAEYDYSGQNNSKVKHDKEMKFLVKAHKIEICLLV